MVTTSAPCVRDQPAPYGPHEVDAEEFPAAVVLEDLEGAPDADVPRIVARYAVLRGWMLRDSGADPGLVRHARQAARIYLAATGDWAGRPALERLARAEPALADVWDAATSARRAGHVEGAYALLRAGYLAARRRTEIPWAARMAEEIAVLLDAEGLDGRDLWRQRADRLRRLRPS